MIDRDRVGVARVREAAIPEEDVVRDEIVTDRSAVRLSDVERATIVHPVLNPIVVVEHVVIDLVPDRVLGDRAVEDVGGDVETCRGVVVHFVVPDDVVTRLHLDAGARKIDTVSGGIRDSVVFDDRPARHPGEDERGRVEVRHRVPRHHVVAHFCLAGAITADLDQAVAGVLQRVAEDEVAARSVGDPDAVAGVGSLVADVDDLVSFDEVVAGLGDPDGVAPRGGGAALGEIRVPHDIVVTARGDLDGIAGDVLDPQPLDHDVAASIEPHRVARTAAVEDGRLLGIALESDGPGRGPRHVRRDLLREEDAPQPHAVAGGDRGVGPVERAPRRARRQPVVVVVAGVGIDVEGAVEGRRVGHRQEQGQRLDDDTRRQLDLRGDDVVAVGGAGGAPDDLERRRRVEGVEHVAVDPELHAQQSQFR